MRWWVNDLKLLGPSGCQEMGGEHPALSPFSRLPPPLSLPQPGSLLPSSCAGGREGQDCLETEGSPFSHICLRRHRAWGWAPFQAPERLFTVHCQRPLWKTGHPGAAEERGRGEGERREGSWGEGEGGGGRWGVGERQGREPPPSHWQPPQALLPSRQVSGPTSPRVQMGPGRMPASWRHLVRISSHLPTAHSRQPLTGNRYWVWGGAGKWALSGCCCGTLRSCRSGTPSPTRSRQEWHSLWTLYSWGFFFLNTQFCS